MRPGAAATPWGLARRIDTEGAQQGYVFCHQPELGVRRLTGPPAFRGRLRGLRQLTAQNETELGTRLRQLGPRQVDRRLGLEQIAQGSLELAQAAREGAFRGLRHRSDYSDPRLRCQTAGASR